MGTTAKVKFEGREYLLQGWGEQDLICKGLLMTGEFYEIELLKHVRVLKATGTYLDLGANIGNHAVFFAAECPCDHVIAIEAYKPVFDLCAANLAKNLQPEKYTALCLAVANSEAEKLPLWTPSEANMGRARKVIQGADSKSFGMGGEIVEAPCVKLDDLMKRYPERKIGLIKLDIEGMEVEALESGFETLKIHKPFIVSECSIGWDVSPNSEMVEISRLLDPLGYRMIRGPIGSHVGPSYIWAAE